MKTFVAVFAVVSMVSLFGGCSKKQEALEEMQQPMAPEDLSRLSSSAPAAAPTTAAPADQSVTPAVPIPTVVAPAPVAPTADVGLEKLPPSGPYKPSNQDIQTALKNAGLYAGPVDGKVGPKTKAAIETFQKNNGLEADGKVGPKTWEKLGPYLTAAAAAAVEPASAVPAKSTR